MLPTFICIGPGRAGTSWLYEVLTRHPQVRLARHTKETEFFNTNYERGLGWYEEFFDGDRQPHAIGEISNRYIFHAAVPERIKNTIPDCRIIACIRDPYERIQSVYTFKLREGALTCGFEEALTLMPELIEENRYFSLLEPYFRLFGSQNVHLLFYEDLVSDPLSAYRAVARFLGIDPHFVPVGVQERVNVAIVPRWHLIALLAKATARALRRGGVYRPLTWAKRSQWIKALLFRRFDYRNAGLITERAYEAISAVVEPELARLETLIGRRVTTERRPAGRQAGDR